VSARRDRVRLQLFVPRDLGERLARMAAEPGVTKSAILADALRQALDRKGVSELQERFGKRLDRLTRQLARIERNSQIEIEVLALLVRYILTTVPPIAEGDEAARAQGRARFEWFTRNVSEALTQGRGSFGVERAL
jgi:hypothetical protein